MKGFQVIALCFLLGACTSRQDQTNADPAIAKGEVIYNQQCLTCHQADGTGVPPLNPPLVGTSYVTGPESQLITVLLNGMSGQIIDGKKYNNAMPAFAHLSDEELAQVLTFVRHQFGQGASPVSVSAVAKLRGNKVP